MASSKSQILRLAVAFNVHVSSAKCTSLACFTSSVKEMRIRNIGEPFTFNSHQISPISKRCQPLHMSLLPVDTDTLGQIITKRLPTPAQYATYWGRTSREQYNAAFEAFGVSFLGVFAAYFLSFAFGQFIATILGMVAASWFLLGPELKAYQRNWEFVNQYQDP